jgi:signal transduction histidine kinase
VIPKDLQQAQLLMSAQAQYDQATGYHQTQTAGDPRSGWRPLHIRAALVTLPLLLLLCAVMLALLRHYSAQSALESTQRMNLGLARYIVEHQPTRLVDGNGQPDRSLMKQLALHVMMINPSVEVYLLNADGRILAHALELIDGVDPVGQQVDLTKVKALLKTESTALRLPIFGDDPRSLSNPNIVAMAALGASDQPTGYLYIILNGRQQQSVTATLANSNTLREVAIGLVLATLLAMAIMLIALRKLTRPLRQLTSELRDFRGDTSDSSAAESGDEISILRSAVRAMQQRIAQQFKRLEDSDNQRRELISNISHDLRTPLSSIQGYMETVLVRGEQIDHTIRAQHLKTALRHVALLGRRISDLFELSKLDAGRVEPKYEAFCLAELLQDVLQNYQLSAQQRGIALNLSAGSHLKTRVSADIALIERVLQNLIDNALRYTPTGGEVSLALQAQGPLIEISVSDTGSGIALEHLPHIFDRYWRTEEIEAIGPGVNSGLGLAIVKRILDLHSSVVRVQSELSHGTRIEFSLLRAA